MLECHSIIIWKFRMLYCTVISSVLITTRGSEHSLATLNVQILLKPPLLFNGLQDVISKKIDVYKLVL